MAKICIIGGSGFVGSRLIHLLKNNHKITILDKNLSKIYPELSVLCDIRDAGRLREMLQGYELVVHLAAEHSDDVSPVSLYYDVNVQGTQNILKAMDICGIRNLIFTSSVAIYGLDKPNPDESSPADPFNHYGKSKWQAEEVLRGWYREDPTNRSLTVLRPTVIFGEHHEIGNVYNLLHQISSDKFIMVGKGTNLKSMAYVDNVAAFINYCIDTLEPSYKLFNYVDKPDMNMNELVQQVGFSLNKDLLSVRLPFWIGYLGGRGLDCFAKISGKKYPVSAVRVKKFCATTQFNSTAAHSTGFVAPFTLKEGLHRTLQDEFSSLGKDRVV
jgi:nucleoside-diphosphate-sugar epimerase